MPPSDDVPDFVAERDHRLETVLGFVEALRRAGVHVAANSGLDAVRSLAELGFDDRDRVEAGLRATLISREEDIETFDRLFPVFWQRLTSGPGEDGIGPDEDDDSLQDFSPFGEDIPEPGEPGTGDADRSDTNRRQSGASDGDSDVDDVVERLLMAANHDGDEERSDDDVDTTKTAVYSPTGARERVEASPLVIDNDDALIRAVDRLGDSIAGLRGRRWVSSGDRSVDLRRTLRQSFGTGGTVLSVPTRGRKHSMVRAVVLVDVSRSVLDVLDRRFVVQFLQHAHSSWHDVRSFFFDTSLREVTDAFTANSPREPLETLERAEAEWGGGTRIGNAVDVLRREHPLAVERDTVVFVISDGLEVGEVELLEEGMAWLDRRARAILWLNPLAGSHGYEPTCRGMRTALPYVDGLFPITGSHDLEEIARQIEQRGLHGPIGYEHDPHGSSSTAP